MTPGPGCPRETPCPDDADPVQRAARRLQAVLDQLDVDLNFAGVFHTYGGRPVEIFPADVQAVLEALECNSRRR